MKHSKDEYEVYAGEFKPTDELEEELEEEGLDPKEIEEKHFDEVE